MRERMAQYTFETPVTNTVDETLLATDEYFGDARMRWYQIATGNGIVQAIKQMYKRIKVILPTGAGKTITVAYTVCQQELRDYFGLKDDEKLKVIFISHRHRLLTQAERTFASAVGVEIICHSMFAPITDEMVAYGWHLTILDEGHHESCLSFQYQLERLGERPILEITATENRPDKLLVKADITINFLSRAQAVAEGYLAETELESIVDYSDEDKTELFTEMVDNFGHLFGQTMVFVATKAEVGTVTQALIDRNYKAVGLLDQSGKETDKILDDFSEGAIQFVVNCNKISEGVDVKGCTDVFLARQIGSYTMLNQIIGRAARPDSRCHVWELIDPFKANNLDTTIVVGTPKSHNLLYKRKGAWVSSPFQY
jgi:superfamily II DNA or RNA helicase